MAIKTSMSLVPAQGGWVGIVYRTRFLRRPQVLTVGVMLTRWSMERWLADVVRRRAWEDASEPPDHYG